MYNVLYNNSAYVNLANQIADHMSLPHDTLNQEFLDIMVGIQNRMIAFSQIDDYGLKDNPLPECVIDEDHLWSAYIYFAEPFIDHYHYTIQRSTSKT